MNRLQRKQKFLWLVVILVIGSVVVSYYFIKKCDHLERLDVNIKKDGVIWSIFCGDELGNSTNINVSTTEEISKQEVKKEEVKDKLFDISLNMTKKIHSPGNDPVPVIVIFKNIKSIEKYNLTYFWINPDSRKFQGGNIECCLSNSTLTVGYRAYKRGYWTFVVEGDYKEKGIIKEIQRSIEFRVID